jgi:hypothetical protein
MIRRYIVSACLIVGLTMAISACSTAAPPEAPKETTATTVDNSVHNAPPALVQTATEAQQDANTVDITDPKFKKPAKDINEFAAQVLHYEGDLIVENGVIQGEISSLSTDDSKRMAENSFQRYEAAIQKARSIPEPAPGVRKKYKEYMAVLDEYEKIPQLLRKGLSENNQQDIDAAFAQIHKAEKMDHDLF